MKNVYALPELNLGKNYLDINYHTILNVSYVYMCASWKLRSLCIMYVIKIYIIILYTS